MKYYIILLLMILFGCGQDPSSSNTAVGPSSLPVVKNTPEAPISTEEVIADQGQQTAKLVASISALPHCYREDEGNLIYVKDVAQFFFCSESMWHEIDLKAAAGKDGKDGKNGSNGQDGLAGEDGIDGTNGKTIAVDENVWIHPVKGTKWFVGRPINSYLYTNVTPNLLSPNFICPEGSRSGTEAEYLDAIAAGLWLKLGSKSPLLVKVSNFTNRTVISEGIFMDTYKFRVGKASTGIADLYPSGDWGSANALCVAIEQ